MNEISKNWGKEEHEFFSFFFQNEARLDVFNMRYYIVKFMFAFIDKKKYETFENKECYYFTKENNAGYNIRKCFESNKIPVNFYDSEILENFNNSLKVDEYEKLDTEIYCEELWKIKFNSNWIVKKNNDKFQITYEKKNIFINSKDNYIKYFKYFNM